MGFCGGVYARVKPCLKIEFERILKISLFYSYYPENKSSIVLEIHIYMLMLMLMLMLVRMSEPLSLDRE